MSKGDLYIGVDPGLSNGVAFYWEAYENYHSDTLAKEDLYPAIIDQIDAADRRAVEVYIACEDYNPFKAMRTKEDAYPVEVIGGVEGIALTHDVIFRRIHPHAKGFGRNSEKGQEFLQKFATRSKHERDAVYILFALYDNRRRQVKTDGQDRDYPGRRPPQSPRSVPG